MKKLVLPALLTLLLALLAACGGTNTTTITMGASTFSTASVSISAGGTLTFTDDAKTGSMHVLVMGTNGAAQPEAGAPDFGTAGHSFQPGQSWTTPPWTRVGTYHVTCQIHPQTMNLTVTVTATGGGY
jgi:plastocyanin